MIRKVKNSLAFYNEGCWKVDLDKSGFFKRVGVNVIRFVSATIHCFGEHHCGVHAAGLTYFTILGFVPVLYMLMVCAKACGVAPIPASSGKVQRHRLDRGGDRQANRALHTVARCRMEHDGRTKAYAERRRSESRPKSDREIVRCLKRYIAREVYAILLDPSMPPHPGPSLAEARKSIGLTQAEAAADLGTSVARLSCFENMKKRYGWLEPLYLGYMEAMLAMHDKKLEIRDLQT